VGHLGVQRGVERLFRLWVWLESAGPDPNRFDPTTQYRDGLNLYGYVGGKVGSFADPMGKWQQDMHYFETRKRARAVGYSVRCANRLGFWDWDVDVTTPATSNPEYHFNFNSVGWPLNPGRDEIANDRWRSANVLLGAAERHQDCHRVIEALKYAGKALHGFQDAYSHQAGGEVSALDGQPHLARTPWQHIASGPNSFFYGDPHRPDKKEHFPEDFEAAGDETQLFLGSLWDKYEILRCVCGS